MALRSGDLAFRRFASLNLDDQVEISKFDYSSSAYTGLSYARTSSNWTPGDYGFSARALSADLGLQPYMTTFASETLLRVGTDTTASLSLTSEPRGTSTILSESFETDGAGTRYSILSGTSYAGLAASAELTDGSGDFFTRTDGSNIGSFYEVTGFDGSYWFAAMDTNGDAPNHSVYAVLFDDINISGFSDLQFSGFFAEDDDGAVNQDWDADALVYVEVDIDNSGTFTKILQFASQGATNTEPGLDTDFDGVADSTSLTSAFAEFTAAIAGGGTTLDVRIVVENLEAGDEDVSFDNIQITGYAPVLVFSEDFETFTGAGFSAVPAAGQLDSDFWRVTGMSDGDGAFGGTHTIGDFARGTDSDGGVSTGGTYAFTSSGNTFMGVQPGSSDVTPGTITLAYTNDTGSTISDIQIIYDLWVNNDQGRANSFNFAWSMDDATYTSVALLDFTSVDTADAFGFQLVSDEASAELVGVNLADGATIYFQWQTDDVAGSGSRDEFGIDDVRIYDGIPGGSGSGASTTLEIGALDAEKDEGDSGTTSFTFIVSRSGDTTGATDVDYVVTSSAADATDFGGALPSGTVSFAAGETEKTITISVSGDTTGEGDEAFTVTLSNATGGAAISEATAEGNILNDDALLIGDIQGATDTSPFVGQTVTITGIVTGDYQTGTGEDGDIAGFFIQDSGDGDSTTSDGIFIYDAGIAVTDVIKGDEVTITGVVTELYGKTMIDVSAGSVTVDSNLNDYMALMQTIDMSTVGVRYINSSEGYHADLEAYESMLVDFVQTLTVIDNSDVNNYNEFVVSAEGRIAAFTQQAANGDISAANNDAYLQSVGNGIFYIDDGYDGTSTPTQWVDGAFGSDDAFRVGATISDAFGIMDFGFSEFRLRMIDTDLDTEYADEITIDVSANARPADPTPSGTLTVANMNVLNYFTTLDLTGVTTDLGFDPRGADNASELVIQTAKLAAAIIAIDADILALEEIENDFIFDGTSAIEALIDEINFQLGGTIYGYVDPGVDYVGSDAISTALIYKVNEVSLATGTTVEILDDTVLTGLGWSNFGDLGALFDGVNTSRPPLAATFVEAATGREITIVVNHLKSKGGTGTGANADLNDGVGDWNEVRELGVQAIDYWLATNPTGSHHTDNVLLLGDFNSYAGEDPIAYLENNGYANLDAVFNTVEDSYSYNYYGFEGTLDYGIALDALLDNVESFEHWHSNADESEDIDYNDGSQHTSTDPWRASDHDPIVIGLDLNDLEGTAGNDALHGDGLVDDIYGFDGADKLWGRNGDDILNGGNGNDLLSGDAGADQLIGGAGTDTAFYRRAQAGVHIDLQDGTFNSGDAAGDTYDSIERFFLTNFDDFMVGSDTGDKIYGFDGSDDLDGGLMRDLIKGGDGDDLIEGGHGWDVLFGEAGFDTFVYEGARLGRDTIKDFTDGEDTIRFHRDTGVSSIADLTIVQNGSNVLITYAQGEIVVENALTTDFTTSDFEFFL